MKDTVKRCAIFGMVTVPTLIVSTAIGLAIVDGVANGFDKVGKKIKHVKNKCSIMFHKGV